MVKLPRTVNKVRKSVSIQLVSLTSREYEYGGEPDPRLELIRG